MNSINKILKLFFVSIVVVCSLQTMAQPGGNNDAYASCVTFMKMSMADQLKLIEQTNKKFGDRYTLKAAIADCTAIINEYNQQSCISSANCPSLYQCINWLCEVIGGPNGCNTGGQCSPGEVCCGSICKTAISCD